MDFGIDFIKENLSIVTDVTLIDCKEITDVTADWEKCSLYSNSIEYNSGLTFQELFTNLSLITKIFREKNIKWSSRPVSIEILYDIPALLSVQDSFISIVYMSPQGHPEHKIWKFPLHDKL